jgi:hypothetical protein
MKTTMLRWSLFSVLSFASASAIAQQAGDAVAFPAPGEPQVIHLDGDTKLTLLGTSYGAHHMAPGMKTFERPTGFTPPPISPWFGLKRKAGGRPPMNRWFRTGRTPDASISSDGRGHL